jgi:hypothetical protein
VPGDLTGGWRTDERQEYKLTDGEPPWLVAATIQADARIAVAVGDGFEDPPAVGSQPVAVPTGLNPAPITYPVAWISGNDAPADGRGNRIGGSHDVPFLRKGAVGSDGLVWGHIPPARRYCTMSVRVSCLTFLAHFGPEPDY